MKRSAFQKLIEQQMYVTITKKNGEEIRGQADYLSEYTNEAFLLDEHNIEYSIELDDILKITY